jgi:hypothetical protein
MVLKVTARSAGGFAAIMRWRRCVPPCFEWFRN